METRQSESFWSTNRITIKGIIVGGLIIALIIPTVFIMSLVQERSSRQLEVTREVSSKWASAQTIVGPLLIVPYYATVKVDENKNQIIKKFAYFLPDQLTINSSLYPEVRHRSIFNITVYKSDISVSGNFSPLNTDEIQIPKESLMLNEARLFLGISDFRGIEEQLSLDWNHNNYVFNSGAINTDIFDNGVSAALPVENRLTEQSQSFSFHIKLKGSERLFFTPVGKTTNVHMASSWNNPSFDGSFIPSFISPITDKGFTADWKVQHLNRNYPQVWKDSKYDISASGFGINLIQPVDSYAKTMRSVKYAILFIALTFALYFFVEILQKKIVHPIQYVLVGLALCIFYTLLLSISEYLAFNFAYTIAAVATILLITLYTKTLFSTWKIAALFGSLLTMLYGFIFILIQLQDGALLFGSIGLFILIAVIMYYSRKIDWYGQSVSAKQPLSI